jgi:hypothetical protein
MDVNSCISRVNLPRHPNLLRRLYAAWLRGLGMGVFDGNASNKDSDSDSCANDIVTSHGISPGSMGLVTMTAEL